MRKRIAYSNDGITLREFLQQGITQDNGCINWSGYLNRDGYGWFRFGRGHAKGAHRVAYTLANGEIPSGLVIDHICRNRACINPYHLQAVTQGQNSSRNIRSFATHCKNGHVFSETNIYWIGRTRACRTCRNAASARCRTRRLGGAI